MAITTLLFDIGDVLIDIDWQGGFSTLLGHARHADGRDMTLEEITAMLHPGPYASLFDRFGMGLTTKDEFLLLCAEHACYAGDILRLEQALTHIFAPLPERIALLNKLIASGKYNIALVSDTNHMHMDYIEQTIPDIFKQIDKNRRYYSHHLGLKKKLGKAIYEAVLNDMGVAPEHALMIDDRIDNKKGADAIGLHFLHILKRDDLEAALKNSPHHITA